jgi:hypothetical protein
MEGGMGDIAGDHLREAFNENFPAGTNPDFEAMIKFARESIMNLSDGQIPEAELQRVMEKI